MKKLFRRAYHRALRPVLRGAYQFLTYRTFERAFGTAVREWKPDIIHAHDGVTLPTAARAAADLGAKLVFDSHELEAHRSPPLSRARRRQVEKIEQTFLPMADKVMTVTERASDYLAATYGIERPLVLFNAQPLEIGSVPARWEVTDRTDVRWDAQINPRDFVFVFTGNVTLNRGLELAVIALGMLQGYMDRNARFRGNYHLVCVGKIQSNQDAELRKLAKANGVADKLHLLSPVAPHRVWKYIGTADAAIIPILPVTLSYEMAMPNKLFEATLAGLPILSSDLMEMGPFVRDNKLGMTFDPARPDDCLEKMIALVDNYESFRRSPERQIELAKKFSWEAQREKLLAMYEDMLSKDSPVK